MNQCHAGTRSLPGQDGLLPVLLVTPPNNIDHPALASILFCLLDGGFLYIIQSKTVTFLSQ